MALTLGRSMTAAALLLSAILTGLPAQVRPHDQMATCIGADPCKACKNCKYCQRCAKDGLKCGVCKYTKHQADHSSMMMMSSSKTVVGFPAEVSG